MGPNSSAQRLPITGGATAVRQAGPEVTHAAMIDAFFDLADAIITVRSLIRQAWTTYRWGRPPSTTTMTTHLSARTLRGGRSISSDYFGEGEVLG